MVSKSSKVRGMVTRHSSRSDKARLAMNTFCEVSITYKTRGMMHDNNPSMTTLLVRKVTRMVRFPTIPSTTVAL